jgi:hypothetical protein
MSSSGHSTRYYPAIKWWYRMLIAGGFWMLNGGGDDKLIGGGMDANTQCGDSQHLFSFSVAAKVYYQTLLTTYNLANLTL